MTALFEKIVCSEKKGRKGHRSCPLCGHNINEKLLNLRFALFDDSPLAENVDLVSCRKCGNIYYSSSSTESDFNDFYQSHYLMHSYKIREHHPLEVKYLLDTVNILQKHGISIDAKIVDVGCGPGCLLKKLKEKGYSNICGVELCQDYVKQLRSVNIKAFLGSAGKLPLEKNETDCFIYKNIFEHLFDLQGTVKEIKKCLKPGGYVLIEVPDADCYASLEDYSPLHYFIIEHINHFDRHHLENLFSLHGFDLVASGTRMLDIAEEYPVPIMYCLFKDIPPKPSGEIIPNFRLAEKISGWFQMSDEFHSPEIDNLKDSGKPMYLWGLSYRTLMQLSMSSLRECNIRAFIDIDPRKQQKTLLGKPIVSPDILQKASSDVAVVIGVGPSGKIMHKHLQEIGFAGKIHILK